jgi:hypothetical protein
MVVETERANEGYSHGNRVKEPQEGYRTKLNMDLNSGSTIYNGYMVARPLQLSKPTQQFILAS